MLVLHLLPEVDIAAAGGEEDFRTGLANHVLSMRLCRRPHGGSLQGPLRYVSSRANPSLCGHSGKVVLRKVGPALIA